MTLASRGTTLAAALLLCSSPTWAQQPGAPATSGQSPATAQPAAPPAYGDTITLEQAKQAMAAAETEAKKNNWMMAIAVVSPSGHLVHFSKLDQTQYASVQIAQRKAVAAATFRRSTKSFEERVAGGGPGLTVLTLEGAIASEGGVPIVVGGKVIGAIGASGGTSQQDGAVANAGAAAVK